MQSEASAHEMARKLLVHSTLDHIFSAWYDVSRLPQLISQVGMQYIGCEFVSMWRYEPSEHVLHNLVARSNINVHHQLPVGRMRLPLKRGAGRGIMVDLALDVLEGQRFEDMAASKYIVNDRAHDPRATTQRIYEDASQVRSAMYAPLNYNGFKGMIVALNHETDGFSRADWEILRILASKAAIVVDNIEQRRQAEESSRLAILGRAVDIVRHEMKAPLTAINGAAAVVLRTVERMEGAPQDRALIEEMARMIASEVSRNVRLLQDIQNYCKPRFELTVRSGSLNHFLESHIDAIGAAAGERRPALVLETDPALPPVAFSREHLVEVLRNFVRNSAESGSARVTVRTERNGRSAIIEVRDEGGGIDEEAIDALFRPYESRKSKSGGSGLGLFICRRIIEEGHGGRVSARNIYEDDARVGLCVRIELPLAPTLEYR